MQIPQLVKSPVVFNEALHTYSLGDKELHGITGMLGRQLFPHKYDNVPKFVLNKAANRGSAIHKACEFTDQTGLPPTTEEAKQYVKMRDSLQYFPIDNEYTVSDLDYFASNIDCVWGRTINGVTEISLADIKTTYTLDKEYLSWQLSIYAYLFELQNPGLSVSRIYGVWLKEGKYSIVEVERKPTEEVKKLLECEKNGVSYKDHLPEKAESNELIASQMVDILLESVALEKAAKEQADDIKSALLKAMELHGVKSWDTERIKATYVPPTESTTFDSKTFKAEHPDLFEKYTKTTKKKASLRLTIRDDE